MKQQDISDICWWYPVSFLLSPKSLKAKRGKNLRTFRESAKHKISALRQRAEMLSLHITRRQLQCFYMIEV